MSIKRQQHKVTINDLYISTTSDVSICFCCLKPLVKKDVGTRAIQLENGFLDSLCVNDSYKNNMIYNEQRRIIQKNRDGILLICFIREPNVKKSLSEWRDNKKKVSYFSKFIIDTLSYVKGEISEIEKNS